MCHVDTRLASTGAKLRIRARKYRNVFVPQQRFLNVCSFENIGNHQRLPNVQRSNVSTKTFTSTRGYSEGFFGRLTLVVLCEFNLALVLNMNVHLALDQPSSPQCQRIPSGTPQVRAQWSVCSVFPGCKTSCSYGNRVAQS